jgi:hypothetical protein
LFEIKSVKQFAEKNKILKGSFNDFKIKTKLDSGDIFSDFFVVNVDKKKRFEKLKTHYYDHRLSFKL